MTRRNKYHQTMLDQIEVCKARKTRRLKARRRRNAALRESGVKFSHKDAAYRGSK